MASRQIYWRISICLPGGHVYVKSGDVPAEGDGQAEPDGRSHCPGCLCCFAVSPGIPSPPGDGAGGVPVPHGMRLRRPGLLLRLCLQPAGGEGELRAQRVCGSGGVSGGDGGCRAADSGVPGRGHRLDGGGALHGGRRPGGGAGGISAAISGGWRQTPGQEAAKGMIVLPESVSARNGGCQWVKLPKFEKYPAAEGRGRKTSRKFM